jgi:hypothetical protein
MPSAPERLEIRTSATKTGRHMIVDSDELEAIKAKFAEKDAMERGAPIDEPQLQAAAQALRALLDGKREAVQALGRGQLENFDKNYFPHIWQNPETAMGIYGRRPLEGSKGFLNARTIPFTTDGLRWRAYTPAGDFVGSFGTEGEAKMAAGTQGRVGPPLKPVTTNPVELALLKAREMDRYVYGQKVFQEMKASGLARFIRFGERAPVGWAKIDDNIARVWESPDYQVSEAYDHHMMQRLMQFAQDMGIDVSRSVKAPGMQGTVWGFARRNGTVWARVGGPETVLTHEIGHQLDYKYGLADQFVNDPATKGELRDLADLRMQGAEGQVTDGFKKYLRKGTEKMANMVHAYVHAPELMKEVAPNTFAKFDQFIDEHPELQGLRDIKPGLRLGTNAETVERSGMILKGEHFAPEEAATIINNHLSPGLQGNPLFDGFRKIGAMMNSAQLGLSLYHVGFTTMDSMVSKVALGLKQAARGDVLQGLGNVAQGLNPAQPVMNLIRGDRLLKAYLGDLSNPDLFPVVDAIVQAGGRVKMDDFYRNEAVNRFKQAVRQGDTLGAAKAFLPTILDRVNAPVFEKLVPRQKLGVFFDMAKDWLEQNPDADVETQRAGLGKLWDSVDNRMGQLVYDNLFWHHTLKDGLMATVRSVGWNLGTFRELGGGALDMAKVAEKGLTDRAAYVLALPFMAAAYGALTQYLYTGQAPRELKDYFFPRTGRIRPDGTEDRVSLPTYMKDVYAYGEDIHNAVAYGGDPTQTIKNKANPLISMVSQMLNNQDYFGGAIRNPADPAVQQLAQEASFLVDEVEPFSLRNYQQQAKEKGEDPSFLGYLTSPSMIGIAPAPGYVTKTPEQQESAAVSRLHDPLVQRFREQIQKGADIDKLVPEMLKSGLSRRDVKYIIESAAPHPHRLKKFGTDAPSESSPMSAPEGQPPGDNET